MILLRWKTICGRPWRDDAPDDREELPDEAWRLTPDRQKAARASLAKFLQDPSLASLRFRLEGATGHFIINGAHGDRIILRKDAADLYAVVDIGPHDNLFRRWNR
jgi:hypothetical protein